MYLSDNNRFDASCISSALRSLPFTIAPTTGLQQQSCELKHCQGRKIQIDRNEIWDEVRDEMSDRADHREQGGPASWYISLRASLSSCHSPYFSVTYNRGGGQRGGIITTLAPITGLREGEDTQRETEKWGMLNGTDTEWGLWTDKHREGEREREWGHSNCWHCEKNLPFWQIDKHTHLW